MRKRSSGACCSVTLSSLFGKWEVLMVLNPFNTFAYLLGLLRSGGSIANRWLLYASRAWTKPCLRDIRQTLHRQICARETNLCLFRALSIRRHSWLSLARMPSPSFQRSLRSATRLHYYGNPDWSCAVSTVQGPLLETVTVIQLKE